MKKLTLFCLLTLAMLQCKSIVIKGTYDHIKDPAFLACVKVRIERLYRKGYIPTDKGFKNIQAGCYVTLYGGII